MINTNSNRCSKIKVMHVVSRLDTGGLENGVINICNALDRKKFIPAICCLKAFGSMAKRLKPDVRLFNLNFPEGNNLSCILKIISFFRKEKPDIVHAHGIGQGSFLCIIGAMAAGIRVIINGEHGKIRLRSHQIYLQRIISLIPDVILSVSSALKMNISLQVGIPCRKITVIPNGVDTSIFNGKHNISEFKKELLKLYNFKINDADFVLGVIGSLKPEKNQKMVLDALEMFNQIQKNNNLRILFAGDGPDKLMLMKYAADFGLDKQVVFLSERSDIYEMLSLINVLSLVSLRGHEGMSNVILEAMSSGVPIISTKSTGSIELINEGENGFLVDPGDVFALCKKIELLYTNRLLAKNMGKKAREIILDRFSLQKMLSSYEALYIGQFLRKYKNDSSGRLDAA